MKMAFDRGTLVCTDLPTSLAGTAPPGLRWDPRTGVYRAAAHHHAVLRAFLLRRGIQVFDRTRAVSHLDIDLRRCEETLPSLRPYQTAALRAWEAAGARGIVALPTGSGKTRLAVAAIQACRLPTLCMVPTRILLAQWHQVLRHAFGFTVGIYGDGEQELAPVTVATFESAYRHMAAIGNRFDLLVVDEAHHFGGGSRDEALEMAIASHRLGLTATPPQDAGALQRLAQLIGGVIYHLDVADLTGRYLADLEHCTLTLSLTADESAIYEAEMACFRPVCRQFFARHRVAGWSDFVRAAQQSQEGRAALFAWRRAQKLLAFCDAKQRVLSALLAQHREARVLVFTADNDTAYAVARQELVMPITCDIGRRERQEALERFARGELRVLVSARVLNEGIDVPDAEVGIIVGGGRGKREHVQRVGRLLRPRPHKTATVYELVVKGTNEVEKARQRRRGLG